MTAEYTGKDGHRYGWLPTTHPGVAHCALEGDMAGCAVAIRIEDIPAAVEALRGMVEPSPCGDHVPCGECINQEDCAGCAYEAGR